MKWLVVVCVLILASVARAAFVPLDAAGCYPVEPTTTATANATVLESATAGNQRLAVFSVPTPAATPGVSTGIFCPFTWPSNAPATVTATFHFKADGTDTSHGVIWAVRLWCFADNDAEDDITWSSATEQAAAAKTPGSVTHINYTAATAAITPGGTVAAGAECIANVYRKTDTNTGEARLRKVLLQ